MSPDPGPTLHIRVERIAAGGVREVLKAADLFDRPPDRGAVAAFLESPDDHLFLGWVHGEPAGFALVHELPRLDGPAPKLFLYEIGTAPRFRRHGMGRALVEAVKELGRIRGARSVFAVTGEGNRPAMAFYAATGAVRRSRDEAVVEYRL